MKAAGVKPRILVADDDAVSLRFLAGALGGFGCTITAVTNGAATLEACTAAKFDLLLLDRRMPDCGGATLLLALRERGIETPAIATSAELGPAMRAELEAAGYVDALTKPLGLHALAHMLATHLPCWCDPRMQRPTTVETPGRDDAGAVLLDDAAGLSCVGGDRATLQALRGLLASELETLRERLAVTLNSPELPDTLHRLRASCRYCGVTALGEAAARLETAIRTGGASPQAHFERFSSICAHTLAALSKSAS